MLGFVPQPSLRPFLPPLISYPRTFQSAGILPVRVHHGDSDLTIPVVRAQHLIDYIGVLRDLGVPVERELERSRLPVSIEETPNDYVSLPRALACGLA